MKDGSRYCRSPIKEGEQYCGRHKKNPHLPKQKVNRRKIKLSKKASTSTPKATTMDPQERMKFFIEKLISSDDAWPFQPLRKRGLARLAEFKERVQTNLGRWTDAASSLAQGTLGLLQVSGAPAIYVLWFLEALRPSREKKRRVKAWVEGRERERATEREKREKRERKRERMNKEGEGTIRMEM